MTSDVTFPLTGYTFTLEMWQENDQRGHLVPMTVNGQSMIRLHALFEVGKLEMKAMIAGAGATVFQGTTATELTIGTGEKTFTTQGGKAFGPGAPIQVVDASDPSRFVRGTSTAYDATTGVTTITVLSADDTGGTGSITAANVSLAGTPGPTNTDAVAKTGDTMAGALDMAGYQFTAHLITHKTGTEHLPSDTETPDAVSGEQALTLVSHTKHWKVVDGDAVFTVSPGTTTNHLTDCMVTFQSDGGAWAISIVGATEAFGETLNTTDMNDGDKLNIVFWQAAEGTVLYRQAGVYFS
jgi:hypothetical protein